MYLALCSLLRIVCEFNYTVVISLYIYIYLGRFL
uniref:Uncharacterized protein n=1 Tax=Populus trichocarpa TaxID=3694 RepID=A9P910_POPTR|nr:unknown [Populus trichocarpa]